MSDYKLLGGPQDGARVTGLDVPVVIFVGPKWLGDGFTSWGREHCERFPCCYAMNGNTGDYQFTPLPSDYKHGAK